MAMSWHERAAFINGYLAGALGGGVLTGECPWWLGLIILIPACALGAAVSIVLDETEPFEKSRS
jgi:hypothetical protein